MRTSSPLSAQRLILLVDDEALVRMGTASLLEELDFRVLQASTGEQALRLLVEHSDIEIMITDYRMPDLDGMELIDRANQLKPELYAILMTGYAADDSRFADMTTPRLGKPFGLTDLERALDQSC
jgi:CheY-like chemotaxis protein